MGILFLHEMLFFICVSLPITQYHNMDMGRKLEKKNAMAESSEWFFDELNHAFAKAIV